MKYRYIIVEEDGNLNGVNILSQKTKDDTIIGLCEVIDCVNGKFLLSLDPENWKDIEPLIEL